MEHIKGVPEGYRLGEVAYLREDRQNITFELIPIENPKQLEAAIMVPIRELGYDTEVSIRSMLLKGITPELAEEMRSNAPDFITIREKGEK